MTPIDLFSKIYDLPPIVRNRMLSAGIPQVVPIAAGLKIRIAEVDDVHATSTMPFTRRSRNHVGSIYLGALLVHAEVTMATLVIGLCRPPPFRVLVKKNEAEFHARATGTVRAVCAPDDDERAGLARCRALRDDKADASVTVRSFAVDDDRPICTVRFLIQVKHKP